MVKQKRSYKDSKSKTILKLEGDKLEKNISKLSKKKKKRCKK